MSKHIKTRINFIEADEVLLPIRMNSADYIHGRETHPFGRQYRTADMMIDELDDDTVQVFRFSRDRRPDDVTEEMAYAYLKTYDAREGVTLDDERFYPLYVQYSMEWRRWKDDLEAERPITGPDDKRVDLRERRYDATQVEGARL